MNHFQKQLICSLLSFLLIFTLCGFLSAFHQKEIRTLLALCSSLPQTLNEDRGQLLSDVMVIEKKLKKAGTSLAFFMHYEHLNEAFLAAAGLHSSVQNGDERAYQQAVVRLHEALKTLMRLEKPSFELFI